MPIDKIHFVIKLKKQQDTPNFHSFCHPSQRNEEHIKMWKTNPNDYWVFSKMADYLISRPSLVLHFSRWRLSQISLPGDVQDVKFPTPVHVNSNSRGLTPPPPPHHGANH